MSVGLQPDIHDPTRHSTRGRGNGRGADGGGERTDEPAHFLRWLRRHVHLDFPAGGFAPRLHYADYLQQTLEEFTGPDRDVAVEHVTDAVRDLRRHGRRLRLTLADGTS